MRLRFIALLGLGLLAGCGPVMSTEYQMVPPPTENGRMCANNCLLAQTNCTQQCALTRSQCQQTEQLRAENEYLQYVQERQRLGRKLKKTRSSFESSSACDSDTCEESCGNSYRICHSNCGGQVIPVTRCTAFCN